MVALGPAGAFVVSTAMADGFVPPSASLNPVAGRVFVPPSLTDDDLDWVNRQLDTAGLGPAVREWPTVPLAPDPYLTQVIER